MAGVRRTMLGTAPSVALRVRADDVCSSLGLYAAPSFLSGSAAWSISGIADTADIRSHAVVLILTMAW